MAEIQHQPRGRAHTAAIAALEVVPFAMLIADGSADVLAVNQRWVELSGLGRAESLGPGWLEIVDPETRARLREDSLRVARDGGTTTVDYQVAVGPRKRWTRWWISRHELEGLPLVAIAAADVEEDYARQANLYHLATHDSLTGLVNRSHFIECIDQALRRSQRQARRVAVVYVDLDGFKRVNDRGGHSLGDRVLFAIAARLRHAVRSADMVARIGGDEFAVLCEDLTATEQADVVARRIAVALTESVEVDGERWSVAASVGAAVDRGDPENAEELVDRADRAMYSIKQTRKPAPPRPDQPVADPGPARSVSEPERRVPSEAAYAYHTPGRPGPEPRSSGAAASGESAQADYLDPGEEARRALRDLAEAAGGFGRQPVPAAAAAGERTWTAEPREGSGAERGREGGRQKLAADVVNLRESIDSIRTMLDRLLSEETGVIDIRDQDQRST